MLHNTVTIGITTYNAENTIRDALHSAFSQTVPIHQIIVVDDKSTDNTLSILQEKARQSNFEIHQNVENRGVAASRNEIIKLATGEFVAFFDDDDISAADRIERQLERILEYERKFAQGAPVICHTARLQVFPDSRQRIEGTMGCAEDQPAPSGPSVARRTLMGEPLKGAYGSCATCSQMARTEVYRALGGFDERFRRVGDFEIAIRLALNGGHFVGIADPLVTQRLTESSEKSLQTLKFYTLALLEKHKAVFDDNTTYGFCREWIELKFAWFARERHSFLVRLFKLGLKHPIYTMRRLFMALPNLAGNLAFSRFQQGIQ